MRASIVSFTRADGKQNRKSISLGASFDSSFDSSFNLSFDSSFDSSLFHPSTRTVIPAQHAVKPTSLVDSIDSVPHTPFVPHKPKPLRRALSRLTRDHTSAAHSLTDLASVGRVIECAPFTASLRIPRESSPESSSETSYETYTTSLEVSQRRTKRRTKRRMKHH